MKFKKKWKDKSEQGKRTGNLKKKKKKLYNSINLLYFNPAVM